LKFCNDQINAQVFKIYLPIYFCLTCYGLSFSSSSEAGVQFRQWFKSPGYAGSAQALKPHPENHCRSCTPASEDELKEGRSK
jgi:E3 ubiquitin-protein ligase DOA10